MSNTIREILNSLASDVEWCVETDKLSLAVVDREKEEKAVDEALAEIERLLEEAQPRKFSNAAMTTTETNNYGAGYNSSLEDYSANIERILK